jgi:uncharacterized membrane protein (DUF4010 family)
VTFDLDTATRIGTALGIGLLLGTERERRRADEGPEQGAAGLRTFALVSLLGALAMAVGTPWAFAVAGAFTVGGALASYLRSAKVDPGLTTEAALVVAFFLGALAMNAPALAAGLATLVTLLLAARSKLHGWVRNSLSAQEFHDALLLLGAALVVLPLTPNRGYGPGDLFNPFTVWRLVVIAMALQAAGYVSLRLAGPSRGLSLAGFLGGFVSSTATIGAMGARARRNPETLAGAVSGALLSNVATVLFLAVVIAATSRDVLRQVAPALLAAGAAAVGFAAIFSFRALRQDDGEVEAMGGRPFDFRIALKLALTVSTVLAVAVWLQQRLGASGGLLGVALGGFADAQAGAISASTLVSQGALSPESGASGVLLALTTNTLSKLVAAWSTGTARYATVLTAGLLFLLGTTWGAWWLIR